MKVRFAAIMLSLFIPWGFEDQNEQFQKGGNFIEVWDNLKTSLSARLRFHVNNFNSLRKSREDVLADRERRKMQNANSEDDQVTDDDIALGEEDSDADNEEREGGE